MKQALNADTSQTQVSSESTTPDLRYAVSCGSDTERSGKPVVINKESNICIWVTLPSGWSNNGIYQLSGFAGVSQTEFDDKKDGTISRVVGQKLYSIAFVLQEPRDDPGAVTTYSQSDYEAGVIDEHLWEDYWKASDTLKVGDRTFYIATGSTYPNRAIVSVSPFIKIKDFPGSGETDSLILSGTYPSITYPWDYDETVNRHLSIELRYYGRTDGRNNTEESRSAEVPQSVYDDFKKVIQFMIFAQEE